MIAVIATAFGQPPFSQIKNMIFRSSNPAAGPMGVPLRPATTEAAGSLLGVSKETVVATLVSTLWLLMSVVSEAERRLGKATMLGLATFAKKKKKKKKKGRERIKLTMTMEILKEETMKELDLDLVVIMQRRVGVLLISATCGMCLILEILQILNRAQGLGRPPMPRTAPLRAGRPQAPAPTEL